MNELSLDEKLRAAHTKRWQIVNVGRTQSMAEHAFLVQIIAIEVARTIGWSNERSGPFNIEKEFDIMRWALWHDMLEVRTGDLNTPTKIKLKAMVGGDAVDIIEKDISAEYEKIKQSTFDPTKVIVKLADYIEAVRFLDEEGKGSHAAEVRATVAGQLRRHFEGVCRMSSLMSLDWHRLRPMIDALTGTASGGDVAPSIE